DVMFKINAKTFKAITSKTARVFSAAEYFSYWIDFIAKSFLKECMRYFHRLLFFSKAIIAVSGFEKKSSIWVLRPMIIDSFGFFLLFGLIALNVFALISGLFIDNGNYKMARFWITIHYLCWSIFCWIISFGIFYFGKRLINIIERHIEETKGYGKTSSKVRNLELGLIKLRRVRVLLLINLFFFAISSLLFGIFREFILTYSLVISLALATCWVLIVPLTNAIIITVLAYEINEKTRIPTLRPKTSTNFQSSRSHDDFSNSKTPPKIVRNDSNAPHSQKGIIMRMDQTISINDNTSFALVSKAPELDQDFMETTSDHSHSAMSREETGEAIELVYTYHNIELY
ncbi:2090_t:CDS:2, partial [Cetraspora pellucida]